MQSKENFIKNLKFKNLKFKNLKLQKVQDNNGIISFKESEENIQIKCNFNSVLNNNFEVMNKENFLERLEVKKFKVKDNIIEIFLSGSINIWNKFNEIYGCDSNYINTAFSNKLFEKIGLKKNDDNYYYHVFEGAIKRFKFDENGEFLIISYNNLIYEKRKKLEQKKSYKVEYSAKSIEERFKIIYKKDNNKLIKIKSADNVMFEYIGELTTEEISKTNRFIANVVGKDVVVPILNDENEELVTTFDNEKAIGMSFTTDECFRQTIQKTKSTDISKIFKLKNNYMYSRKFAIIDFVLDFAAFEEKIKWEFLKKYFQTDEDYEKLYEKYNEEIGKKAKAEYENKKISPEKLNRNNLSNDNEVYLKNILNKENKQIFIKGLEFKSNELNNFPKLIEKIEYSQEIKNLCKSLFKNEYNKSIEEFEDFSEIKNFKNQKIWLLYNLINNPKSCTDFRNVFYHSLRFQSKTTKLRVYSEVIQLLMYYLEMKENDVSNDGIKIIFKNIQIHWDYLIDPNQV